MGESKITFLVMVKNVTHKSESTFREVVAQASRLSTSFVFVDDGSSDSTYAILEELIREYELSADIYLESDERLSPIPYKKWKYASKIQNDYIFLLDDDEVLSDGLISEIQNLHLEDYKIAYIKWDTYLLDECVVSDNWKPTLFSRHCSLMTGGERVHYLLSREALDKIRREETYYTKNPMYHYSYPNIDHIVDKTIKDYARKFAKEQYQDRPDLSRLQVLFRCLFEMNFYMLHHLITKRTYTSVLGFFRSFNHVSMRYYKWLYYLEYQQKNE